MSRRKIFITVSGVIVIFLLFFTAFIRTKYVVPILMYHSVNPEASPENRRAVSVKSFERQMRFLKIYRYNVLPLEALADLIKEKKKIPARTVALTFDDGYKDIYTYAFPILKRYNLPATMFIIVDEVGRPDRLSWDEIEAMRDSGVITLGSHALGPDPLTKIKSEDELKRQIFDSRKILQERLSRPVTMFSYPEGRFNANIRHLVMDAGYRLAVATSPGKKYANDDTFALKRLRISSACDNLFVFWFETCGLYTFIREQDKDKK